jgi:hypothetical protein
VKKIDTLRNLMEAEIEPNGDFISDRYFFFVVGKATIFVDLKSTLQLGDTKK